MAAKPGKLKTNVLSSGKWASYAKKRATSVKKSAKAVAGGFLMTWQRRGRRVDQVMLDLPHLISFGAVSSWPGEYPYMWPRGLSVAATRDSFISGAGLKEVLASEVDAATHPVTSRREYKFGSPPRFTYLTCGAGASAYVDSYAVAGITTDGELYGGESVVNVVGMPTERPLGVDVTVVGHWVAPVAFLVSEDTILGATYGGRLVARELETTTNGNRIYLPVQMPEPATGYDEDGTTIWVPVTRAAGTDYDHGDRAMFVMRVPVDPATPLADIDPPPYRTLEFPNDPQFEIGQWIEEDGYAPSYIVGELTRSGDNSDVFYGVLHAGVFADDPDVYADRHVEFITTMFRVRLDPWMNAYWDVIECNVSDPILSDRVVNADINDPHLYWYPSAFTGAGSTWAVLVSYSASRLQAATSGCGVYAEKNITIVKDDQIVVRELPADYVIGKPGTDLLAIYPRVYGGVNTKQTPFACHISEDDRFGITFLATDRNSGGYVLMKWDSIDGFSLWDNIDTSILESIAPSTAPPVVTCYRRQTVVEGQVTGDPGFVVSIRDNTGATATLVVTNYKMTFVTPAVSATAVPMGNQLSSNGSTSDAYQVYNEPQEE